MRIEQLTCNIGAELFDVHLADAVHNDDLFGEIKGRGRALRVPR